MSVITKDAYLLLAWIVAREKGDEASISASHSSKLDHIGNLPKTARELRERGFIDDDQVFWSPTVEGIAFLESNNE